MIKVRELTKIYGQHTAIDHINFTINEGEVIGFLGPNGAGKTTTMNIMTGYIAATSGDVSINGVDILADPEGAKANIGYLPDTPPVYGEMRVDEYLHFVADLKKVPKAARWDQLRAIKQAVHIDDMSRRLIKNLSRGYRQRVGLAQAMVGEPRVIIMDEPTIGLDPKQIIEMREVIKRLGKKHTVMLSSHIMQEVSAVCDRVMIIHKGKIIASDTPEKLAASLAKSNRIQVRIKGEKHAALAALAQYPVIRQISDETVREPGTVDLILTGDDDMDIREPIFRCMARHELPILSMKTMDLSLEEIFLTLTGAPRNESMGYLFGDAPLEEVPAEEESAEDSPTEESPVEKNTSEEVAETATQEPEAIAEEEAKEADA